MRFVALGAFFLLAGCLDGPSFMRQSSRASLKSDTSSEPRVVATEENAGVLTAGIDPTSTVTQIIESSGQSDIAGTKISLPPGAIGIATSLSVEKGADLTGTAFESEVGLTAGSLTAASATVVIDSSVSINATQPFTVSILIPSSSLHLMQESQTLVVLFRYKDAVSGKLFTGVIPPSDIVIKNGSAEFKTAHFGAFQLAYSEKPIEKAVKVETAKEIVTVRDVQNAAPIKWSPVGASFDLATKTIKAQSSPDGMAQIDSCFLVVDSDKQRPWDQVAKFPKADTALSLVWTGSAGTVFAKIECSSVSGISSASEWSPPVQIVLPAPLKLTVPVTNINAGQNILLSASGGVAPYSFLVESGAGSVTPAGLFTAPFSTGTVVVAVRDAASGTARMTLVVKLPTLVLGPAPSALLSGQTFQVQATGGVPPYHYSSSRGSISPSGLFTAPHVNATCNIVVTDAAGQTASFGIPVTSPALTLSPSLPEVAYGGSITFSASGGKPPYTYSLSGYGYLTTAGVYTAGGMSYGDKVRVTDSDGAYVENQVQVYHAPYLYPLRVRIGDSIPVIVTGGKPPYAISLTNGFGSLTPTDLYHAPSAPGIATISVTDAFGQSQFGSVDVRGRASLDPSWSQSGYDWGYVTMVSPQVGNRNYMHRMVRDASGRFVIVGMAFECCVPERMFFAVSRLNPDGFPDYNFGSGGGVTQPFPIGSAGDDMVHANAVAVHPNGDIYVAGKSQNSGWLVMRFNDGGTLVTDFGIGGARAISFGAPGADEAFDIKIASDGDILVAGVGDDKPVIMKLDRISGAGEESFGTDGEYVEAGSGVVRSMEVLLDGSVAACGRFGTNFGVRKISSTGTAVAFSNTSTLLDAGFIGGCRSIALDPVSRALFVAGFKHIGGNNSDWVIGKYAENGDFDAAFNTGVFKDLAPSSGRDVAESVHFDTGSGFIYVAGSVQEEVNTLGRGLAMRLFQDGSVDATFVGDGTDYRRLANTSTAANKFYAITVVHGVTPRVYILDTLEHASHEGSRLLGVIP